MEGFIGVHLGAGLHNEELRSQYKKLINEACLKAVNILRSGGSALNACSIATAFMEDSPLTNAGYGSNLTWQGNVECDASVMDGCTLHYGAVGGVAGVKNPILLAKLLCENQKLTLPCGRVPPSFLVGDGARTYAVQYGLTTVAPADLITVGSWKMHQHYRRKIKRFEEKESQVLTKRLDTVGAVCVDSCGNVAASCSSGGIALKTVGRVGQAAVYASGVWAQNATAESPAVASCTSGCGEYLVRTMLAREGALSVLSDERTEMSLHDCMKRKFLESPFLRDVDDKMGGICLVKYNPSQDTGEFLWAHSTTTMCVGYMNVGDRKSMYRMSRLNEDQPVGKCLAVEGIMFHCKRQSRKRPASPIQCNSDLEDGPCSEKNDENENEKPLEITSSTCKEDKDSSSTMQQTTNANKEASQF